MDELVAAQIGMFLERSIFENRLSVLIRVESRVILSLFQSNLDCVKAEFSQKNFIVFFPL